MSYVDTQPQLTQLPPLLHLHKTKKTTFQQIGQIVGRVDDQAHLPIDAQDWMCDDRIGTRCPIGREQGTAGGG